MNAERLHVVAMILSREISAQDVPGKLQTLVSALQSIVQSSNANTQQVFVSNRDAFYAATTDTPSDSFTPAWRQILAEMGGEELFGKNLKQRVQQILADNQMTPGVAHEQIQPILTRLQAFKAALDQLVAAFGEFKIGSEHLAPGEAEIALLIPRDAVHNKLGDFADELEELEFVLNTFSEVATGRPDDLKIRTVSSSGLMVFLSAGFVFAGLFARAIDFVVGQYKKILEIKKLAVEIERLQLPDDISVKTKEHANTLMEAEIEKFTVEIVNQYPVVDDGGRKNELTTAVRVSLNRIANRIDRGFNFEVRIEPPKALAKEPDGDKEIKQALKIIDAAAVNMQYLRLVGPPILALPEKMEPEVEGEPKADGDVKPRKRAGSKKDEAR